MYHIWIETGRYTHTPVDQRICQCGNEVETEEHFLLRCPIYDTHRDLLYDNINAKLNINVDYILCLMPNYLYHCLKKMLYVND